MEESIEAVKALSGVLDNEGGAMETAKAHYGQARKYEEMLELLNDIAIGQKADGTNFQYKKANITMDQL